MGDRLELAILADSIPAFLAALTTISATDTESAAIIEKAMADCRTTDDPIIRVSVIMSAIRALGAAGAGVMSDWTGAAGRVTAIPAATLSPALNMAKRLAKAASALISAACWQEAAVAAVSRPASTRQGVIEARAALVAGMWPALDNLAALAGQEAHEAASRTFDIALEGLDRLRVEIASLALIEIGQRLPSTVLAWRLYGDPARAGDIVAQSGVATPMMLPSTLILTAPTS